MIFKMNRQAIFYLFTICDYFSFGTRLKMKIFFPSQFYYYTYILILMFQIFFYSYKVEFKYRTHSVLGIPINGSTNYYMFKLMKPFRVWSLSLTFLFAYYWDIKTLLWRHSILQTLFPCIASQFTWGYEFL